MNLSTVASTWPTQRACSGKRSSDANRTEMLRLWPTAKACDGIKPSAGKRKTSDLTESARAWATPSVADATGGRMRRGGDRLSELLLKGQAALWATPQAHDAQSAGNPERVGRFGTMAGGRNLNDEAALWATPAARDWKSGQTSAATMARNSRPLNEQAVNSSSLPAPVTKSPGRDISNSAPTLNPRFVEALMGWPSGWTGFDFAATA
jgi:hypothetical protein